MSLKVSIIVPIYGVEKYIKKCATSIFEQTYSNLDIIFINDCTKDNSVSILEETLALYPGMRNKVRILSNGQNIGIAGVRQMGIEAALGDYSIQIDGDDYVSSTMVEDMIQVAISQDADIVISDYNTVYDDEIKYTCVNPSLNPRGCMKQILIGQVHGSLGNKLIRHKLYREYSIDFVEGLNMCEDMCAVCRLLYFSKKIVYLPKALYFYFCHSGSLTTNSYNISKQRSILGVIKIIDQFYLENKIKDFDLIEALNYFKAGHKGDMLLRGQCSLIDESLFHSVQLRHFVKHPSIGLDVKILGVLSTMKLPMFVSFIRKTIIAKKVI